MKIIAIEGLDKSGKHTLTKSLVTNLKSLGHKVAQMEFHDYQSPTGELIAKWLRKEYDVDQNTIEFLMAADKQAKQADIQRLDDEGHDFLIIDRYTLSQAAYALTKGIDVEFVSTLQQYMRQPDHNIILDIPAEISMSRKGKHNNGENDRYESDLEFLKGVRETYLSLTSGFDCVIDGTQDYNEIRKFALSFCRDLPRPFTSESAEEKLRRDIIDYTTNC